jgi:hypothetical protein
MGPRLLSSLLPPYHETIAKDNHIRATITGERKVMEMCYIHCILTEITHTMCYFICNYLYETVFMGFPSLQGNECMTKLFTDINV